MVAAALAESIGRNAAPLIHVVASQRRARSLHALVAAMRPELGVGFLPEWNGLPRGNTLPSPAVMGRRMGLLRWLLDPKARPALVLATAAALVRRVPPRWIWNGARFEFRAGQRIAVETIARELERIGYFRDGRVDLPGEFAIRGQVIDLFPAAADMPCRIEHDDGAIVAIRSYDPRSQRSLAHAETLLVDPASEAIGHPGWIDDVHGRETSSDATTTAAEAARETIFDYAPTARMLVEPEALAAAAELVARGGASPEVLTSAEWTCELERRALPWDEWRPPEWLPVPRFVEQSAGAERLRRYLTRLSPDWSVVLAAPDDDALNLLSAAVQKATGRTAEPADWAAGRATTGGRLHATALPIDRGFQLPKARVVVLAPGDVVGARASGTGPADEPVLPGDSEGFRVGDLLLHLDHGLGQLEGIDQVEWLPGRFREAIRLRYAGDRRLIVPVSELASVWRYGGGADGVPLSRLDDEEWSQRRRQLQAEIDRVAVGLLKLVRARRRRRAPRLIVEEAAYERFAAGFPFRLSDDQAVAVEAVLRDLASGHPMDRIVCGDVGFGKTEVALRAAAVAILSGHAAVVVAPTTVLARQHWRTFRKRFQPLGVDVAYLAGTTPDGEAARLRSELAEGRPLLVVGTHAVVAEEVRLRPGSLIVIDEEHRFGAEDKAKLRRMAKGGHVLTLTATPIPRTLQATLAGLQDLSVVSAPPADRHPVRTIVTAIGDGLVAEALRWERRRGGQSFLVCPRIGDIPGIEARVRALVPDLKLQVLHGRMKRTEMEERMAAFADGDGDVLLSTNIIENGLDIPNANTMLVWRADRFGLAQLHQLRGRVGRGEREGVAYLLTAPDRPVQPATARRLRTLEEADQLGAGFVVSRRDLDQRGGGDLLGDEQAGHTALLGADLYRHLFDRALRRAAGDEPDDEFAPDVRIDLDDGIPQDYVPEAEMRIALYAATARLDSASAIDGFATELVDRFGPRPEAVDNLLALCRLRALCRRAGIARLTAGPKAIVLHLREGGRALSARLPPEWAREDDRLVLRHGDHGAAGRAGIGATIRLLERIAGGRWKGGGEARRSRRALCQPGSADGGTCSGGRG